MNNVIRKICGLGSMAALAIASSSASAQSATDSFVVGVDVEVAAAGAVVSGLNDISIAFDGSGGSGLIYRDDQAFCIFTPTQLFNLTIQGTAGPTSGAFYVKDEMQADASLAFLRYNFHVFDLEAGSGGIGSDPTGTFQNNVTETGIDSSLFNIDATCSTGPNLLLKFSIVLTGDPVNGPVVSQLVDGQLHNYKDSVTVILDPAI